MRTDDFDFDLPGDLIAQHPASPRDSAWLLEISDRLVDREVTDLPTILRPGDVLVLNDTKVVPTRLRGRRGEAQIEVTLHQALSPDRWRAFARPGRRLKPGDCIEFAGDFRALVEEKNEGGEVTLRLETPGTSPGAALETYGAMPLPPYIHRKAGANLRDRNDYQTIFAETEGAVAAPTAGLHFTERLFESLDASGIQRVKLTLHVGAGTFLPIKSAELSDHKMHGEAGVISPTAAETINTARAKGGRVVAVGSTSLRLLESAADQSGLLQPFEGETALFITPGYRFKIVDLFLTNFHLPRSTLFVLVAGFAGLPRMKAAYAHAIENRYRFYSYGDCCLLHRGDAA